jgi:trigger factor
MAVRLTTERRELDDSRVRVDVSVAADDVEKELNRTARALAGDMKVPGFRQGKAPAEVVLRRAGREAVLDEAVRRGLPAWYEQALAAAHVAAVGSPDVSLAELPGEGEPLEFSFEVSVRPTATLGDYKGLEVGRREPEASDEEVGAELEQLRESVASLETVERPAADGDFVVLDFVGTVDGEPFEGGEARGYLLELGSDRLVEGFEEQLAGAAAGEQRQVTVTFPGDYRAEHLAGREAVFDVSVKEVKEKRLPELDDDLAAEAGGFDTLDELREDIRSRMLEAREREIDAEFREAAVDAAADAAGIDLPQSLVHAKSHEMWETTKRRLAGQGIDPARYLQLTGKSEHELIEEAEPEAERALKRESVLAAVVEAEGIEVDDDELFDSLRQATAQPGGGGPSEKELTKAFERMKSEGRDEALREDIALRKAVDVLVEGARPIPLAQAEAREKLWTPDKETKEKPEQIWTPGG